MEINALYPGQHAARRSRADTCAALRGGVGAFTMALFFKRARGRMSRASLHTLMGLDPRQLSDIGLTRHDVADAMRQSSIAADLLSARRHERALSWLR